MKYTLEYKILSYILLFGCFVSVMCNLVFWFESTRYKHVLTCSTVGSYEDAQQALISNPNLDGHPKDGKACDSLLKK